MNGIGPIGIGTSGSTYSKNVHSNWKTQDIPEQSIKVPKESTAQKILKKSKPLNAAGISTNPPAQKYQHDLEPAKIRFDLSAQNQLLDALATVQKKFYRTHADASTNMMLSLSDNIAHTEKIMQKKVEQLEQETEKLNKAQVSQLEQMAINAREMHVQKENGGIIGKSIKNALYGGFSAFYGLYNHGKTKARVRGPVSFVAGASAGALAGGVAATTLGVSGLISLLGSAGNLINESRRKLGEEASGFWASASEYLGKSWVYEVASGISKYGSIAAAATGLVEIPTMMANNVRGLNVVQTLSHPIQNLQNFYASSLMDKTVSLLKTPVNLISDAITLGKVGTIDVLGTLPIIGTLSLSQISENTGKKTEAASQERLKSNAETKRIYLEVFANLIQQMTESLRDTIQQLHAMIVNMEKNRSMIIKGQKKYLEIMFNSI